MGAHMSLIYVLSCCGATFEQRVCVINGTNKPHRWNVFRSNSRKAFFYFAASAHPLRVTRRPRCVSSPRGGAQLHAEQQHGADFRAARRRRFFLALSRSCASCARSSRMIVSVICFSR